MRWRLTCWRRAVDINLLRARIGMVFQKLTPFPMTIDQNIAFGILLYEELPRSEVDVPGRARLCAALRCGRKSRTTTLTSGLGLSGGQQQRLCIARTVVVKPGNDPVLDEPC